MKQEIERIISLSDPYSSGSAPTCFANGDIEDRSGPKLFVFCSCGHSEFIHSDRQNRVCLWSECHCSGFALRAEHTVGPAA